MNSFPTDEKHTSQLPALQLLETMGYTILTPTEALAERQNRLSNILLEKILEKSLRENNRIQYKGATYKFSEENIQTAIQKIKNVKYDGLVKTNESIYDLLTLGTSLDQSIEGNTKSFTLNYIDWRNPANNQFHATMEYKVERKGGTDTIRPDIVLFVNGIPFVVIECKAPHIEITEAISQCIRNQGEDYIPRLFTYTQLLIATNKNSAKYATTGTKAKFWATWKEPGLEDENTSTTNWKSLKSLVQTSNRNEERTITEQDKILYALCRPERLLELAWKYTVFDAGEKKIARYQQYFVIRSTLDRVKQFDTSGARKGGIIWQTQGSGKSLTMVMLTRCLVLDPDIPNPRIVLVTDRDDLDTQLKNTFIACGLSPERASSGRNLLELVSEKKSSIITTLVHKFEKAFTAKNFQEPSPDIFILVDESHRTQFGSLSARMRQMFPHACYLGFTGTPLLKKEKNNFAKFGELLEPHYGINQAVEDGSVVPLLYEGRHVEMTQNQTAMDSWFERHTQGLSESQKTDLKRKYARAEMLNKTDQVIYMRAFDISEHYRENWQGTGFKGQLVAPNKASALKYHQYLNEIGMVTSEVIISPPDMREGFEETDEETTSEVVKFWQKMMKRFSTEENYTKTIIGQFKNGPEPEIIIVVDKLLTGFDAPKNTVLYLCRMLREHTLLQAIARVNRLFDGKDFGYIIDYVSVLGELDNALNLYCAFEGYDAEDIQGTLRSIREEIERLPQLYSHLWDIFKTIKHSKNEEDYELLLADEAIREDFYERLTQFAKCLGIALSSETFLMNTDPKLIQRYKADLARFEKLRGTVKLRYAEAISYKDYEPKIKKLLDTHIQAHEVVQLNEPVNIFDEKMFNKFKDEQGIESKEKSLASRADSIAYATKKAVVDKMEEDPAFYKKFSELIQKAIDDFRKKRISDLEYLDIIVDIRHKVVEKIHEGIPEKLSGNGDAIAYYGVMRPIIEELQLSETKLEEALVITSIAFQEMMQAHLKVNFWEDEDAQNRLKNEMDDYLYDTLQKEKEIPITIQQMDEIIENVLQVARHRSMKA